MKSMLKKIKKYLLTNHPQLAQWAGISRYLIDASMANRRELNGKPLLALLQIYLVIEATEKKTLTASQVLSLNQKAQHQLSEEIVALRRQLQKKQEVHKAITQQRTQLLQGLQVCNKLATQSLNEAQQICVKQWKNKLEYLLEGQASAQHIALLEATIAGLQAQVEVLQQKIKKSE